MTPPPGVRRLPADPDLLRRYLTELGLDAPSVSPDGLRAVTRAHAQRFAHDTVWIARKRVPEIEHVAMAEALVSGEGGGCMQLNFGMAWLLDQLGFPVSLHRTRVQTAFESAPHPRMDAHLVLTVALEEGTWYADAGLGNGLLEAVPLAAGAIEQPGGFRYALEPSDEPGLGWRFFHDRKLMALRMTESEAASVDIDVFRAGVAEDVSDPESPFVKYLTANRRRERGVSTLIGRMLVRRGEDGRSVQPLASAQEWEAVLREEFLLRLPDWSDEERDRLWARTDDRR